MKNVVVGTVVAIFAGLFLAGCASPGLKEFTAGNGDTIRIIDTGVDLAGGPRTKLVQVLKQNGTVIDSSEASHQGTFQSATHLGITAPVTAGVAGHYQKAAAGALRPAEYNNSETMRVEGGSSNSNATGGNAQGGNAFAQGGQGGEGGAGGGATSLSEGGEGGGGGSVGDVSSQQYQSQKNNTEVDSSTHATTNRYNTSTVNNPVSVSAKNGSTASVINGNGNKVEQAGVNASKNTDIQQ